MKRLGKIDPHRGKLSFIVLIFSTNRLDFDGREIGLILIRLINYSVFSLESSLEVSLLDSNSY